MGLARARIPGLTLRLITSDCARFRLAALFATAKVDGLPAAAARDAALVRGAHGAALFVRGARVALRVARHVAGEVLAVLLAPGRALARDRNERALLVRELRVRINAADIRRF